MNCAEMSCAELSCAESRYNQAHYIFHPSTIWVRPLFTELGPKKTQKADFAMKQTNICRLSGDIMRAATVVQVLYVLL